MVDEASRHFGWFIENRLERVTLILTNRCNFNCEYCISRPRSGKGEDLPVKYAKEAIDYAKKYGLIVRETGGEPSLHKDFLEISAYAIKKGVNLEILTNGSFIPTEPKKFNEIMGNFLSKGRLLTRKKLANVEFQISIDPVHYGMDKRMKDRLFLLANFIQKRMGFMDDVFEHLAINVRGGSAIRRGVWEFLTSVQDLSPKTIDALGGPHAVKNLIRMADLNRIFNVQDPESIVKVGGARNYKPSPELSGAINVRDFDIYKEMSAGLTGGDIAINPKGNVFASVYSAYENMNQTTKTPKGYEHPRPFRLMSLGNMSQGMPNILKKLSNRVVKWQLFMQHPASGYYNTRDLQDGSARYELKRRYTSFLQQNTESFMGPCLQRISKANHSKPL